LKDNVVAPLAPVTTEGSLADLPARNAAEAPTETAFSRKTPSGGWTHLTWSQFAEDVAVNRGIPVRIFASVAEAEQWLRDRAGAGA